MTTITAVCIVLCVLIVCLFTFLTIVYFSELKREQQLRKTILEENQKIQDFIKNGNLPVMVMDGNKVKEINIESLITKDKKSVN